MHKFKKDGTTYDTYWKMSGSSADLDWYLALLNMSDETVFAQGIRVKDTGIDKDGKMWTADDYVTDYFNKISEAFGTITINWKNQVNMELDARMPSFIQSINGTLIE
mgnify:FL=1